MEFFTRSPDAMARRVVAGLLATALASVAADGNATTARAVSPVAEELIRLGVFDRVVVVCEAGVTPPLRLTRRADDDCRRHHPGGGAWPDDLQDRVVVVGDYPRDVDLFYFLCSRGTGKPWADVPRRVHLGYRPLDAYSLDFCRDRADLLAHLEVAAVYGRNASTLVVSGDSVAPDAVGLDDGGDWYDAARRVRDALQMRRWEVLRLSSTFVHALSPKPSHFDGVTDEDAALEDPAHFTKRRGREHRLEVQELTCRPRAAPRPVDLTRCRCPEACACARAGDRLCVAAASPGRPKHGIKTAASATRRCDVRDVATAYALAPAAAAAATRFYRELQRFPHWAYGRHVPTFDAYVAARFDAAYALPPLAAAARLAKFYVEDGYVRDAPRRRLDITGKADARKKRRERAERKRQATWAGDPGSLGVDVGPDDTDDLIGPGARGAASPAAPPRVPRPAPGTAEAIAAAAVAAGARPAPRRVAWADVFARACVRDA